VSELTLASVEVLNVPIAAATFSQAVQHLAGLIESGQGGYVCVTGVHGVMESQRSPEVMAAHRNASLCTADGMPMVWAAKYVGLHEAERVYGPDLMLALCEVAASKGWPMYFYGGAPKTPELLAARMTERYPALQVAGCYSPPFRALDESEKVDIADAIQASKARLVWVGLSTPKQELWMTDMVKRLDSVLLLGVGAAFDMHTGNIRQAPRFIQRCGFEWLFRLCIEPRRLWRRYLVNNVSFLSSIIRRHPTRVGREGEYQIQ
jgi:N-acetylglucosaminyldiphosphoundecaprenol N-acetyl-beta-D-mannosaminyltransferase